MTAPVSFTDVSYETDIAQATIPFVGFGDGFLDYDNDGWKDLLIANGHVYPKVDKHPEWGTTYAQRPLLFHNLKNGKFELVPAVEGTGLAEVSVGRGAAFGDIFNDGKIDVVINNVDGVPVLLRNVNPDHHHWVELKLIGGPKSPRDAVGATVYLTAGGIRQRGDVLSGGSYLSSNDLRVHFGLGDAASVDGVEITGPVAKGNPSSCRLLIASIPSPRERASRLPCAAAKPARLRQVVSHHARQPSHTSTNGKRQLPVIFEATRSSRCARQSACAQRANSVLIPKTNKISLNALQSDLNHRIRIQSRLS